MGHRLRARRGNVRSAILTLLGDAAMNGYQIMQAIEQRSEGTWRPSSGSIYPTLQQLEDEGLVEAEDARASQGSSRTYKVTAKGKRYISEHREELEADWATPPTEGLRARHEIMQAFQSVAAAAMQIVTNGTAAQIADAKTLLVDVRRRLYLILAEDPATRAAAEPDDERDE
jgi:DNA-binding PadR family transcriptional regulator